MASTRDTSGAKPVNYDFKLFTACAMVLVVAGHLQYGLTGLGGPFDLFKPYSYQVAAFVFVSGYFYREKNDSRPLPYIIRKAKRLIIPLYLISLVYGCIWTVLKPTLGMEIGETLSPYNVLIAPLTSGHQYMINLAMWFIAPLFFAEVANVIIRRVLVPVKGGLAKETALFAFYLALGAIAIHTGGKDGLESGWLLLACRSAFFLACFGMGRYYATALEKYDTLRSLHYFAIVVALKVVIIALLGSNYTYFPSWCQFSGGVIGTYAVTMLGIAFLLRICKVLGPAIGSTEPILAIADNSYSIMCHHIFGFFVFNCLLAFVSLNLGVMDGFDFEYFLSNYNYVYTPHGCKQFVVAYTVVGILFSLAVHAVWDRIETQAQRNTTA